MRMLYFDCSMGVDVKRLAASLLGLMPDKDETISELNKLNPGAISYFYEERKPYGIRLLCSASDPESLANPDFWHISSSIKENVDCILNDIKISGTASSSEETAWIVAGCFLLEKLHPDRILSSAICVGEGRDEGGNPLTSPSTMNLLRGIPICGKASQSELSTSAGAAMIRHIAENFQSMSVNRIIENAYGFAAGQEEKSCVIAYLGEIVPDGDTINVLHANIDDMTGEAIGFAEEMLWQSGALDVYTTAIGMKKNRPATMLSCICRPEKKEKCIAAYLKYTTTLGVRIENLGRRTLDRTMEVRKTSAGDIRVKKVSFDGTTKWKAEYDDLSRIAREKGIPLREAERYLSE